MARVLIPALAASVIHQQTCSVCGQDQWVRISAQCRAEWVGEMDDQRMGILFIEKPTVELVDQEGNPLPGCPGCSPVMLGSNPQEGGEDG